MCKPGDRVTVALSGGADSVCLFHLLRQMEDISLSAVHVHHGIRETADRDEAFVADLCKTYEVPLIVRHVDVPMEARMLGTGLEETARRLRYAVLDDLDTDHIALAHHCRDQAETLLLNLCRGSGLTGLAGMPAVRGRYIRPLLNTDPEEIRAYLIEQGFTWVEDETNEDPAYRRNYLRHAVLPLLEQNVNVQAVRHMADTAALLQEDLALLEEFAAKTLAEAQTEEGLSIAELIKMPKALRFRVWKQFLEEQGTEQDLSRIHYDQLDELLMKESGHRVELPHGISLERSYDTIRIWDEPQEIKAFRIPQVPWHGRIDRFALELNVSFVENVKFSGFSENLYTKTFDYDTIKDTLVLRTRKPGDYLTMAGGRKKLKEYMIDEKIPRHLRDQVPVLADGSHILWVIGHRMSHGCKLTEHTKRAVQVSVIEIQTNEREKQ